MERFFDFVVANCIAVSCAALYGLLFAKVVFRFWTEVFEKSDAYKSVCNLLVDRWDAIPIRQIGSVICLFWIIPMIFLLFLVAPILWIVLGVLDAKKKREKDEENRQRRERIQSEVQLGREKQIRIRNARQKWLEENRGNLVVYYNTMGGVTAVLTPKDYESVKVETERRKLNGLWSKEGVLVLSAKTVVFATAQGMELARSNYFLKPGCTSSFTPHWRSQLDHLGVKMVHMSDIFVPFVSEAVIPFDLQSRVLRDHCDQNLNWLVELQIPDEIGVEE